jgi:molybdate transport system ATP-binding protein
LLVLDEPSDGLDPASRQDLLRSLDAVAREGTQLLYATHRFDELVPATSHVLLLERGAIVAQGPKGEVLAGQRAARLLRPAGGLATGQARPSPTPAYGHLIRLANAWVALEGETVLQALHWEIAPGQNWLLLGPNGAGKTTLLRLLAGDLRPVFGGSLNWFGEPRRPSLWELRRRISLVSAGLQAQHVRSQSGLDTVLSGLFGSIGLHQPVSEAQRQAAQGWLDFLGLAELAGRDVTTLSYGQLRKVLIARAMVTDPEILLLDEPLSGLDAASRAEVAALLGRLAASGACLVCVTHHPEEVASFMSHVAVLEQGRMVFQGSAQQYWQRAGLAPGRAPGIYLS